MSLLGSVIGAVASGITKNVPILGDIVGGITDAYGQRETNQANLRAIQEVNKGQMQLAEYQYEKNLEQWRRENEYNTPYEQMRRLEVAGLNPYLMYTQGSTGQAGSSPQYQAPNLQAYHQDTSPLSVLGQHISETAVDTYLKQQMQKEQIKSMQYDNAMKEANTEKIVREQGLLTLKKAMMSHDVRIKRIAAKYYEAFQLSTLGNMEANYQNTVASTNKLNKELGLIAAQEAASYAAASLSKAEAAAARELINKYRKEIEALAADIALKGEQANLARQQALFARIQADWTATHGPGKNWFDTMFNLPNNAVGSVISFANKVGLHIASGLTSGSGSSTRVNPRSPVSLGLRGFTTLAPGRPGAVDGFKLR